MNADDPLLGELARGRERLLTFGVDDPRHARPALQHAADSTYCIEDGTPYDYAAAYVGHLGDYRCPTCGRSRLPLDVAAREIELRGLDGSAFTLVTPAGSARIELLLPGLYNVYNAVAAAALATALDVPLDEVVGGLERFVAAFGRFERIAIGDRRLLMLLIKNPAGANEAVRTLLDGEAPRLAVIALNDEIADGRDVSWIWDVDFEPLLDGLDRVVASGSRAAELALRFAYGGLDTGPHRGRARARAGPRPRPRADPAGRRARGAPDLHGDAGAAADRRGPRPRRAVLGARRVRIRVGHLYPDRLNIYADRGNIAVCRRARPRAGTSST